MSKVFKCKNCGEIGVDVLWKQSRFFKATPGDAEDKDLLEMKEVGEYETTCICGSCNIEGNSAVEMFDVVDSNNQ